MSTFDKIFWEFIYIAANICIAKWQANLFDKKQEKINHAFWGWAYFCGVTAMMIYDIIRHPFSWDFIWLWLSALTIHFPLFSAALNYFRTPHRSFDYHNTADTNGSKFDLWLGKWYVPVWLASVAGWAGLQFLIF